jgi:hypothetical protein
MARGFTDNESCDQTEAFNMASDCAGIAIAMNACGGGQGNQGMSSAGSSVTPSAPSLRSIAIMATRTTIAAGATLQFTAAGTYSDKSTQTLTNAMTTLRKLGFGSFQCPLD